MPRNVFHKGKTIDLDVALTMMDKDLREEMHFIALREGWSEQKFFDEYCDQHQRKFGKEFKAD